MADTVVGLRGNHPQLFTHGEANAEAIERLEQLLEGARSGHIRAFAYTWVGSDRSIHSGWAGNCDDHDMTCGVSKLFYRFLASSVDE